jgi:filamentous hemagglutinin
VRSVSKTKTSVQGGSNANIPGIDKPFRPENPNFPGNSRIKDLYDKPSFRENVGNPGYDCSEIAEDIASASGGNGDIIKMTPNSNSPFATIKVPESVNGGLIPKDYISHEVFTDGQYAYDPRMSSHPIPLGDYNRMMDGLNPGNIQRK